MKNLKDNPPQKNDDFFKPLELGMTYFDRINEESVKEQTVFGIEELKNINASFYLLTSEVIKKNLLFFYSHIDKIYFVGDKFEIHQFTKKYFDFLKFAQDSAGDITLKKMNARNNGKLPIDYDSMKIEIENRLQQLKDPYLPGAWEELWKNFENDEDSPTRMKLYLQDYCFKLEQSYEIFVVIATLMLLLCRYYLDLPTDDLLKVLESKRKLSFYEIFENKNGNNPQKPLLLECLSKIFSLESKLILFAEEVFGINGIREVRNLITHHLGETDKCEFIESGLKITFPDKSIKEFTIKDIQVMYTRIFTVSVQLFLISLRQQLNASYILGKDLEAREMDEIDKKE